MEDEEAEQKYEYDLMMYNKRSKYMEDHSKMLEAAFSLFLDTRPLAQG